MIRTPDGRPLRVVMIAAVADNGVIAEAGGALPWHLPDDLRHFKRTTSGHPVIMGRTTFETLPAPLPQRTNIVMTRQEGYRVPPGVIVAGDADTALRAAAEAAEPPVETIYIAGGGVIYAAFMDRADELDLTRVHAEPDGTTRFPEIDETVWHRVAADHRDADARHTAAFTFERWVRTG